MKVRFSILYKNGHEDEFIQEVTEENKNATNDLVETVRNGLKNNTNGIITFGDSKTEGSFIRLSDISRMTVEVISFK